MNSYVPFEMMLKAERELIPSRVERNLLAAEAKALLPQRSVTAAIRERTRFQRVGLRWVAKLHAVISGVTPEQSNSLS